MDLDGTLRLFLLFFLFWGLVFFTSSEAALFSLGNLRLQKLKEENHPRQSLIAYLLNRPRRLIISLLIGNEAINVAISSLTSALFIGWWGDGAKWVAIPVVVLVILLFGELIPKTIGVRHPQNIAPLVAYPVSRFVKLVGPLHWGVRKIVDSIFHLARVSFEPSAVPLTEEDFKSLVETSQREGALEEAEKHMIHRVFELGDQTARNIMTPRSDVFALPLSIKVGEAIEALKGHRFSRVPIFRNNLDEIAGVLYAKDLLATRRQGKRAEEGRIGPFVRKPHFVPLSKKLDDLLKEFQIRRFHLAIVVDEYGKTAGVVTLEDLLEELFGEIYDELDRERHPERRRGRSRKISSPGDKEGGAIREPSPAREF